MEKHGNAEMFEEHLEEVHVNQHEIEEVPEVRINGNMGTYSIMVNAGLFSQEVWSLVESKFDLKFINNLIHFMIFSEHRIVDSKLKGLTPFLIQQLFPIVGDQIDFETQRQRWLRNPDVSFPFPLIIDLLELEKNQMVKDNVFLCSKPCISYLLALSNAAKENNFVNALHRFVSPAYPWVSQVFTSFKSRKSCLEVV